MPFCNHCAHDNPDGSNYCGRCGTKLSSRSSQIEPGWVPSGDSTKTSPAAIDERDTESLSLEEESAVNALPEGSALLIVQRGSNAGSRYLLNTDVVTAGRHQESDIFLDDISVSRKHANFTRTDEGTMVKDLGSLNGTYVNRNLVDEGLLRNGDEVQIGKFRLVYFASSQDAD